jgi:hypothetical protein
VHTIIKIIDKASFKKLMPFLYHKRSFYPVAIVVNK